MNIRLTARARQDFSALPRHLKTRARKQFDFLQENLRHPSIQAKKYDASADVCQGRVNRDYRFYFQIAGDEFVIIRIVPHPK
jgi:mRNA-degrading endonuclease RelE of RelBE toxin-antitoxin system